MRKVIEISMPNCCRRRRSRSGKPRTQFSALCFFSSGKISDMSSCKDGPSTSKCFTMGSIPIENGAKKSHNLVPKECSAVDGNKNESPDSHTDRMDCISPCLPSDISTKRNTIYCYGNNTDGHISPRLLSFTPDKEERLPKLNSSQMTPGSVVWAKNAALSWWPAEVLDDNSAPVSLSSNGVSGCVLVRFFGNHEVSWVDPTTGVVNFDDDFEERCCDHLESFQDALDEALCRNQTGPSFLSLEKAPDNMTMPPVETHECSDMTSHNTSDSTKTEDNVDERGKGKRQRRPKRHFDEISVPTKSSGKVARKVKIMRHLGLVAPPGSPFSLAPRVGTACRTR